MTLAPLSRAELARAVASVAAGVPGVARLSIGTGVEAATQYAGGKVQGVRLLPGQVEVHLVLDRLPVWQVVEVAHRAIADLLVDLAEARQVIVVVDELAVDHLPSISFGPGR